MKWTLLLLYNLEMYTEFKKEGFFSLICRPSSEGALPTTIKLL